MKPHTQEWIDAYFDDALPNSEKQRVEQHLTECPICRDMLEQRTRLAILLQEARPAEPFKSDQQFVAEINRQLGPQNTRPAVPVPWLWVLIPLGLFLAWGFITATGIVSELVALLPVFSDRLINLIRIPLPSLPLPVNPDGLLSWIGVFGFLNWRSWTGLAGLIVIGLLYGSWFAAWWSNQRFSFNRIEVERK